MKINKKALFVSIACVCVALSYFLFSYTPLDTELQLTPEWTTDITKAQEEAQEIETLFPFRFGQTIGYFTDTGKISLVEEVEYKATYSKDFYALYTSDAENIQVFDAHGKEHCVIDGAGFPFIQQDRIFLMLPGGASFAFVNNADGTLVSTYENTAPITSFNSSKNGAAVGYANGDLLIFAADGSLRFPLNPGASDFPVILGGAISNDGQMFACICGQQPQRLVLYKDEGTYQKIIYHKNLSNSLTRQTYLRFSDNDNFVYFDTGDSLIIIDTVELESTQIKIDGMILNIQESPVSNSIFIFSRKENNYTVTILENYKEKSGEFSFDAETAFIFAQDNSLYVGRDGKISRITISKE